LLRHIKKKLDKLEFFFYISQ